MRVLSYIAAIVALGALVAVLYAYWPRNISPATVPDLAGSAVGTSTDLSSVSSIGQTASPNSGKTPAPNPTSTPNGSGESNPTSTTAASTTTTATTSPSPAPASNEIYLTAYTTSYAAGDNDPAGSTVTYISGEEGNAGGTGTYSDPITLAVGYVGDTPDIPAGTMFYIPNVRRYFIAADTCAECHETPKGAQVWVDMYAGDYSGKGVLACEDEITGNHTIIENPSPEYAVVPGSLYDGASCTAQYGDTPLASG